MKYGETIYNLRKSKGYSQEKVAEALDVTRQSISLWETDQASPSIENLLALSKLFHVTIDEIVNNNIENKNSMKDLSDTIEVEFSEDKKAIIHSLNYGLIVSFFYVALFLTFLIIKQFLYYQQTSEEMDLYLASFLTLIFLCWIIVLPISLKGKYDRQLNEENRLRYQFKEDSIRITQTGKTKSKSTILFYNQINRIVERKDYLLLIQNNQIFFIPKMDNYPDIKQILMKKKIKTFEYHPPFSPVFISKLLCILLPFLSLMSSISIMILVTSKDDFLLWLLFAIIPLISIIYGGYSKRLVRKPYYLSAIVLGLLFLLFAFMGLIAIFAV